MELSMPDGYLDQSVNCDSGLVKNTTISDAHLLVQLAWLKSVNKSNYEDSKVSGSASFEDIFGGDYNNFNEKRNQLLTNESFNFSEMQSRQLLLSKTPPDAIEAWRACVLEKMNVSTLAVWIEEMDEVGGIVALHWKMSPAAPTLKDVTVTMVGGTDADGKYIVSIDSIQGEKRLLIKRVTANKEVHGTVNGKAGAGGDFSSSFYLPAQPPEGPTRIPIRFGADSNILNQTHVAFDATGYKGLVNFPADIDAPNSVEWSFFVKVPGYYRLDVEIAAVTPRPVTISLNGVVITSSGLDSTTGGWTEPKRMAPQGRVHLVAGENLLRIWRDSVFPTISAIQFIPV